MVRQSQSGIVRLYTARQVVEQRGTIASDHTVAREPAAAFHDRLRQFFAEGKCITTFGPYSPRQAVAMKRIGSEGIYLGGCVTSAKGGTSEDSGPDLASYPLSQVTACAHVEISGGSGPQPPSGGTTAQVIHHWQPSKCAPESGNGKARGKGAKLHFGAFPCTTKSVKDFSARRNSSRFSREGC